MTDEIIDTEIDEWGNEVPRKKPKIFWPTDTDEDEGGVIVVGR